jgi:hypothetical protein
MEPPTPTSTGATHLSPTKDSIDAVPDAFATTRTLFNRMKDPLSGLDVSLDYHSFPLAGNDFPIGNV